MDYARVFNIKGKIPVLLLFYAKRKTLEILTAPIVLPLEKLTP